MGRIIPYIMENKKCIKMFETTNQFIFITSPNYFDIRTSTDLILVILDPNPQNRSQNARPQVILLRIGMNLHSPHGSLGRQVPRVENLTGGYSWGRSLRYIPHGNAWNMGETTNPL